MTRSRVVPSHDHTTYDVKSLGYCRACDDFLERQGLSTETIVSALQSSTTEKRTLATIRLLAILSRVDPETHAQYATAIAEGAAIADAVDEVFGDQTFDDAAQTGDTA